MRHPVTGKTRREFLCASMCAAALAKSASAIPEIPSAPAQVKKEDREFLEDFAHRCFLYFVEQSDPQTGMTMDRARNDGSPSGKNVASSAATGFALTAYCIGVERKWMTRAQARARVLKTLNYFWAEAFHDHGFFLHFMDGTTGQRKLKSEVSSIDTALFLTGVLTASEYFWNDREIRKVAKQIFDRVDFTWMLDGDPWLLSHGSKPGSGFIKHRWSRYSEASVLYLMAIGSTRHPIPAQAWYAWERPLVRYEEWSFISGGPLFTHQFSHAWVDFRHQEDGDPSWTNFFRNSQVATYAHRDFCVSLQSKYPIYGPNMWGITVSDSPRGYVAWGGPPRQGPINGTVVPCAAAGSLMFAPDICLPTLYQMRNSYGDKVYQRYGFTDAFNPSWTDPPLWVNPDVVGIDVGISLLSIENLLTGNIWRWFMKNPYVRIGMERSGFRLASGGRHLRTRPQQS